nr:hypothetical protein [Tateyamaria pelophila]
MSATAARRVETTLHEVTQINDIVATGTACGNNEVHLWDKPLHLVREGRETEFRPIGFDEMRFGATKTPRYPIFQQAMKQISVSDVFVS